MSSNKQKSATKPKSAKSATLTETKNSTICKTKDNVEMSQTKQELEHKPHRAKSASHTRCKDSENTKRSPTTREPSNKTPRAKSAPISRRKEIDVYLTKVREKEQNDKLRTEKARRTSMDNNNRTDSDVNSSAKSRRKRSPEMAVVRRSKQLRKEFHEDIEWPPDSPAAKVYDVSNSPAKLVILNNQHKDRRLRGYDNHPRPPSEDPDRHVAPNYPVKNHDRHTACNDSSTPVYKPSTNLKEMWVNSTLRPAATTDSRRHAACQVPTRHLSLEQTKRKKPTGVKAVMRKPPINVQNNPNMIHPRMNDGDKKCMYFIAQAYDLSNIKRLKQLAYRDLLMRQQYLGFHKESQYVRYMKYLEGPRKKQFGEKESLFQSGQRGPSTRPESAPPGPLRSDRSTPRDASPTSTPRAVKLGPLPVRKRPKTSIPRATSPAEGKPRRKPFLQQITESDSDKSHYAVQNNAYEEPGSKSEQSETTHAPPVSKSEQSETTKPPWKYDEKASTVSPRSSNSSHSSKSSRTTQSSRSTVKSKGSVKSNKEERRVMTQQQNDPEASTPTKDELVEHEDKVSVRTTSATNSSETSFQTRTETEQHGVDASSRYESDTKTVTESGWSRGKHDTHREHYKRLHEVEEERGTGAELEPGTGVGFVQSARLDQDEALVKQMQHETFDAAEDNRDEQRVTTAEQPPTDSNGKPFEEETTVKEQDNVSQHSETDNKPVSQKSEPNQTEPDKNQTEPDKNQTEPVTEQEPEKLDVQKLKGKSLTVYFKDDTSASKDAVHSNEPQGDTTEHETAAEGVQDEPYDQREDKPSAPSESGVASSVLTRSDSSTSEQSSSSSSSSSSSGSSVSTQSSAHAHTSGNGAEDGGQVNIEGTVEPVESIAPGDGTGVAFIQSSAIDTDKTLVREVQQQVFDPTAVIEAQQTVETESPPQGSSTKDDMDKESKPVETEPRTVDRHVEAQSSTQHKSDGDMITIEMETGGDDTWQLLKMFIIVYGESHQEGDKIWLKEGQTVNKHKVQFKIDVILPENPSHIEVGHKKTDAIRNPWLPEKVEMTCPSININLNFCCPMGHLVDGGKNVKRTLLESNTWNIDIYTSNVNFAGTDANIFMIAYGRTEDNKYLKSNVIKCGNEKERFETNKKDSFRKRIDDIGKPYKILIWHDGTKPLSGWHLDRVEMSNAAMYRFPCNRWLSKGEDDKEIVREIPAEGPDITQPQPLVKYKVDVHTGNEPQAGTDANVFLTIFGEQGDTGERYLHNSNRLNKFERNQVDTFLVEAVTLKQLKYITIRHDGTNIGAGWFLDKIVIQKDDNTDKDNVNTFDCARWFDSNKDDSRIERDLYPDELTDDVLLAVAKEIGHERTQLAIALGISLPQVQQIEETHRDAVTWNVNILTKWRDSLSSDVSHDKRKTILKEALGKIARNDIQDVLDEALKNKPDIFDIENDVKETGSVSSISEWGEDADDLRTSREGKDRPKTRLGNRPRPTDTHTATATDNKDTEADANSLATNKQQEFYEQAKRMRFKRVRTTLEPVKVDETSENVQTNNHSNTEVLKSVEEVEIVHDVATVEDKPMRDQQSDANSLATEKQQEFDEDALRMRDSCIL